MNDEELEVGIRKALEAWTLQNLCDTAILLLFVALALVAGRSYLEGIRARLSLRVASEVWDVLTDYGADLLLFGIVVIGLMVVNPDVMADIKVALPWVPLAFVLAGVALVIRAFHGGRVVGSKSWWAALVLIAVGCAAAWFGFTFVMEAAGKEYLERHPSALWQTLRNMRSDLNPDFNVATFLWAGPTLALVFLWAMATGVVGTVRWARQRGPAPGDGRVAQRTVIQEGQTHGQE